MARAPRHLLLIAAAMLAILGSQGCGIEPGGPFVPQPAWRSLEPGLELGSFEAILGSEPGSSTVRVLRVDPERFELRLFNASNPEHGRSFTAREWCARSGAVAAINASMFQEDLRTSVSLMRSREHVNNPRLTRHMSVLAFDQRDPGTPRVKLIDLECEKFEDWEMRYASFVQGIRMLSCQDRNVWGRQTRKWSTAAIGTDDRGHVLFIHVRAPFATHDLIDRLARLPLDLQRLMYAEGGPEAQMFVQGPDQAFEFVGGFESAFTELDNNRVAWPLPNVIGVVRREG